MNRSFLAFVLCIALCLTSFISCGGGTKESGQHEIVVSDGDAEFSAALVGADKKATELFEEKAKEYNVKWDTNDGESEIASVNTNKDVSALSEPGKDLLLESIKLCGETDGKLDITLLPFLRLWGFHKEEAKVPQDTLISLLLSKTGMDTIKVDGDQVTLGKYTMLDLSATKNGHSADLLALDMAKSGSQGGKIVVGDVTKTFGNPEDGSAWEILLTDPKEKGKSFGTITTRGECSVATASIYDQYFISEGTHYCNIIDPSTGYPIQNDLVSATVISRSALRADGFSTALMVMGSDDAIAFQRQRDDFDMILVLKSGKVLVSSSLVKTFRLTDGSEFDIIK